MAERYLLHTLSPRWIKPRCFEHLKFVLISWLNSWVSQNRRWRYLLTYCRECYQFLICFHTVMILNLILKRGYFTHLLTSHQSHQRTLCYFLSKQNINIWHQWKVKMTLGKHFYNLSQLQVSFYCLWKYRKHIKFSSHSVYMQVRKISRKEINLLKWTLKRNTRGRIIIVYFWYL